MYTTLNKIRANSPCRDGWARLLRHLGKTWADDEPLSLLTILDNNGFDDAVWCLRAVDGFEKEIRLFTIECARDVQHLMDDPRSLRALDVAEAYARGRASREELTAAREDAWDAALTAGGAATGEAAMVAARNAARNAAWDSPWAVWNVTWAAALAAGGHTNRSNWVAAREKQAERFRAMVLAAQAEN